jgi:pimeloyl-ACP methyl ester carboxylesterase
VAVLERDDGVELFWEERGEGPSVVIACHWSGHPPVFEPLIEQLVTDHRIVTYDARGTGRSTRQGPHDIETGAADLAAITEIAEEGAVVVAMTDATNHAVRVAASRPDLVAAVVSPGAPPLPLWAVEETEALISSHAVRDAFIEMLSTNYRGAQRTLMAAANAQMSEDEVRERVEQQVAYCPAGVALERVNAWIEDDPLEAARETGDRLWITYTAEVAGPWIPGDPQFRELVEKHLPEANLAKLADGVVSRPDLTAEIIREISSAR